MWSGHIQALSSRWVIRLSKNRKPVSIRRNVFRLSMPVLLSSLFQRLVSIVDIFLTGGLGAAAITAVSFGVLGRWTDAVWRRRLRADT